MCPSEWVPAPMSGLAGSGSCQVRMTRRVAKLTTDTDPCGRLDTYINSVSRLGYSPWASAPVLRNPNDPERAGVDLP